MDGWMDGRCYCTRPYSSTCVGMSDVVFFADYSVDRANTTIVCIYMAVTIPISDPNSSFPTHPSPEHLSLLLWVSIVSSLGSLRAYVGTVQVSDQ